MLKTVLFLLLMLAISLLLGIAEAKPLKERPLAYCWAVAIIMITLLGVCQ